ncbi:MAG: glycosyltransferase [Gemmatimonadaceae bacterium]|nr:glycosyltransferase [Gemmatimonadaceae bacterium]
MSFERSIRKQGSDLLALCHLRWNWVFQRPQHLMRRAARSRRVFVLEEPIVGAHDAEMRMVTAERNLCVVTPYLPHGLSASRSVEVQRALLDEWIEDVDLSLGTLWYYTPMALPVTAHLEAETVIYDCMDELSAFAGAPDALQVLERQLMQRSHAVFTGGVSLYEAKCAFHPNVHAMPSCVEADHFRTARSFTSEPASQQHIGTPRLGFCGVIDERLDLELVRGIAEARPDWNLVFVGPVTKIDEATLPTAPNIHYLGSQAYDSLPHFMSGWSVGLLPFALNKATEFISPTKTPEYLAAGLQVVSTPIRDVVRSWGESGFVRIAGTVETFIDSIAAALRQQDNAARLKRVDRTLALHSWDATWQRMQDIMHVARVHAA